MYDMVFSCLVSDKASWKTLYIYYTVTQVKLWLFKSVLLWNGKIKVRLQNQFIKLTIWIFQNIKLISFFITLSAPNGYLYFVRTFELYYENWLQTIQWFWGKKFKWLKDVQNYVLKFVYPLFLKYSYGQYNKMME